MNALKGFGSRVPTPIAAFLGVVGLAVLGAMSVGGSATLAAAAKADFALAATPTAVTAVQGQVATYTINIQKMNGFKNAVGLTASNLPAGSSASFSPQSLDIKTSSTFAVTVGSSTTPGTYKNVTVTGSDGSGLAHAITVSLTVTAAPAQTFALASTPSSATMLPGETASYSVSTTAVNGFTGTISFSVAGAPAGSTSTFTPASIGVGGSVNLQVATKNNAAGGNYTLTVTGTSGTKVQTATITLVLATTGKQFTVTLPTPATLTGPGSTRPLNLTLTNPNKQALQVTNLTVTVQSVSKAANASPSRPCTAADYAVVQFSGAYPLTVPAGRSVSLSSLVPSTAWPALTMRDTSSNQDGCKGASLALSFSGSGQG